MPPFLITFCKSTCYRNIDTNFDTLFDTQFDTKSYKIVQFPFLHFPVFRCPEELKKP